MVTGDLARPSVALTVFTPTYNRARLLPRLCASVRNQTEAHRSIEWLIVDDGSDDDTKAVAAKLAAEAPGLVRYLRVPNGGKHRAMNVAARAARGAWIMIVDSDDYVAEGALRNVLASIRHADADPSIGLVRGIRRVAGSGIRRHFAVRQNPGSHASWVSAQDTFDTAEVIRRSALALHPFPEIPGERFMSEAWLWCRLDRTHKTLFVDDEWIVCEYQPDGLTANSLRVRAKSPRSAMLVYQEQLSSRLPTRSRIRASINWWRFRCHCGSANERGRAFKAALMCAPIGWLMAARDKVSLRRKERR